MEIAAELLILSSNGNVWTPLSKISTDRDNWTIKVRVLRMWDAINTKNNEFISLDMIFIDEEVSILLNLYCVDSIYYADSILLKIIILPTHHIIQHPWLLYIFTRRIMEDTDISHYSRAQQYMQLFGKIKHVRTFRPQLLEGVFIPSRILGWRVVKASFDLCTMISEFGS